MGGAAREAGNGGGHACQTAGVAWLANHGCGVGNRDVGRTRSYALLVVVKQRRIAASYAHSGRSACGTGSHASRAHRSRCRQVSSVVSVKARGAGRLASAAGQVQYSSAAVLVTLGAGSGRGQAGRAGRKTGKAGQRTVRGVGAHRTGSEAGVVVVVYSCGECCGAETTETNGGIVGQTGQAGNQALGLPSQSTVVADQIVVLEG